MTSELPDHDSLHAAFVRRDEAEARAIRGVGQAYEKEARANMVKDAVDTGIEGAQASRDSTRAYVKRLRREQGGDHAPDLWAKAQVYLCDRILKWLDGQAKRAAAKPGGVERKRRGAGGKGGGR